MALLITCPDCEAENRVEDDKKGKSVPCKTCGVSFKVTDDAKFVEDPKEDKKSKNDLDDEDKPKKKKSGRTDLDDEEDDKAAERKKRRRERDDDDDDARRGRARGHTRVAGGMGNGVIIGGSVFGLVVAGIIAYFVISSLNKVKKDVEKNAPGSQANNNPGQQQTSEFERNLQGVKNADRHACMWFGGQDPKQNPSRRTEVAQALEAALTAKDTYVAMDAARSLGKWGDNANVPGIIKAMNTPHADHNEERSFQETLIGLLGDMKDPQAAKALVDWVLLHPDRRNKVVESLRKIGPGAETEVQRMLGETEIDLQIAGCKILKDIGSQASVPLLDTLANTGKLGKDGKSRELNKEAALATKAIGLRKK